MVRPLSRKTFGRRSLPTRPDGTTIQVIVATDEAESRPNKPSPQQSQSNQLHLSSELNGSAFVCCFQQANSDLVENDKTRSGGQNSKKGCYSSCHQRRTSGKAQEHPRKNSLSSLCLIHQKDSSWNQHARSDAIAHPPTEGWMKANHQPVLLVHSEDSPPLVHPGLADTITTYGRVEELADELNTTGPPPVERAQVNVPTFHAEACVSSDAPCTSPAWLRRKCSRDGPNHTGAAEPSTSRSFGRWFRLPFHLSPHQANNPSPLPSRRLDPALVHQCALP